MENHFDVFTPITENIQLIPDAEILLHNTSEVMQISW